MQTIKKKGHAGVWEVCLGGSLGGGFAERLVDVCSLLYRQPPMFILISPLINLPIAHGVHYS